MSSSSSACREPTSASDKFSVRPKISEIYDQVLCKLPAIEDQISDEGSDDEVTLFTRNIPSLNSQVLTDFLEDPSEAEALISSEKTTTADKEKKTSSGFSLVASTSSTQESTSGASPKTVWKQTTTVDASTKRDVAKKPSKYEDFEKEAERIVSQMFKSEDSRPNYAEMLSLADRGGISDDNIDTILNRMSPPPPSMPLASKSNLINGFDAEVSTYNSRQASSMNLTGFDSNSRFVPIKEAPPPHFDPEESNDSLMDRLMMLSGRQKEKLLPTEPFDESKSTGTSVGVSVSLEAGSSQTRETSTTDTTGLCQNEASSSAAVSLIMRELSANRAMSTSPVVFSEPRYKSMGTSTQNDSAASVMSSSNGMTSSNESKEAFPRQRNFRRNMTEDSVGWKSDLITRSRVDSDDSDSDEDADVEDTTSPSDGELGNNRNRNGFKDRLSAESYLHIGRTPTFGAKTNNTKDNIDNRPFLGQTSETDLRSDANKVVLTKTREEKAVSKSVSDDSWAWPRGDTPLGDAQLGGVKISDMEDTTPTSKGSESAISVSSFLSDDDVIEEEEEKQEACPTNQLESEEMKVTTASSVVQSPEEKEKERLRAEREKEEYERLREERRKERARLEAIGESRKRLKQQLMKMYLFDCEKTQLTPAANTEPLYDVNESYSLPVPSIPLDASSKYEDLLLLTLKLDSPNLVSLKASNGAEFKVNSLKHFQYSWGCFHALISWFVSLSCAKETVEDSYKKLRSSVTQTDLYLPFTVVSLQQRVLQKELIVQIAVAPAYPIAVLRENYFPRKKQKNLPGNKGSIFNQIVSKFLSSFKLCDVIDWSTLKCAHELLPDLVHAPAIPDCFLSSLVLISGDKQQTLNTFDILPGHFWHTINYSQSGVAGHSFPDIEDPETHVCLENPETVLCLVDKGLYAKPHAVYSLFLSIAQLQLNVSGLRLLHPYGLQLESSTQYHQFNDMSTFSDPKGQIPVLALALRGYNAFNRFSDIVGPMNPPLARITHSSSLTAKFGNETCCFICVPKNRRRAELLKYFGGRVNAGQSLNTRECQFHSKFVKDMEKTLSECQQKSISENLVTNSEETLVVPPSMLCASEPLSFILVVLPAIPVRFAGFIISVCTELGLKFTGFRRCFIDSKLSNLIGVEPSNVANSGKPEPAMFIRLVGENNHAHLYMLKNNLYSYLRLKLDNNVGSSEADGLFTICNQSSALTQCIGGDFDCVPNLLNSNSLPSELQLRNQCNDDPFSECVTIVCLVGSEEMQQIGTTIGQSSNCVFTHSSTAQFTSKSFQKRSTDSLELLGIKYFPKMSKMQAREVTVFEVGDKSYGPSLDFLTSMECVVLCIRATNVFERVRKLFNIDSQGVAAVLPYGGHRDVTRFMSYDQSESYKTMKLFFNDSELFADDSCRETALHYPTTSCTRTVRLTGPNSSAVAKGKAGSAVQKGAPESVETESIYSTILSGAQVVCTCIIVKPDACFRFLPFILRNLTRESFSILGLELLELDEESDVKFLIGCFKDDPWECSIRRWCDEGPVCVLCVQRVAAISALLSLLGAHSCDPASAKRLAPTSWTAQFGRDQFQNGFLVPKSYAQGLQMIAHFFPDGICSKSWKKVAHGSDGPLRTYGKKEPTRKLILTKDLMASTGCSTNSAGGDAQTVMAEAHSIMNQINVLILPHTLINSTSHNPGPIESSAHRSPTTPNAFKTAAANPAIHSILFQLRSKGVSLVGMRMVWMTRPQATQVLKMIGGGGGDNNTNAKHEHYIDLLLAGPCLVVAVHKDNVVICFDQMLGSSYDQNSCLSLYGQNIIRPSSVSEANNLLPLLFDHLLPNDYAQIVPSQ